MNRYPATFRTYILNGLEHWLAQVAKTEGSLAEQLSSQVFHLLNYGLKLEDAWNLTTQLLMQLEPKLILSKIPEEWLLCLEEALSLSQQKQTQAIRGNLHLYIGYVYERNRRLEDALLHYQKGAACFLAVDSPNDYARSLNRVANIQRMSGDFAGAQQHLNQVIELLPADNRNLSLTYSVLGWVYFDQSDWSNSRTSFERALQFSRDFRDKGREATLLRDIGSTLQMQSEFAYATLYYDRAAKLFAELDNQYELAITEMNLGAIYLHLRQWQESIEWLNRAHNRFQTFEDLYYLGMNYTNQGIAYRGLKRLDEALRCFETSVGLLSDTGHLYWTANALDELGVTLLDLKSTQQAALHFNLALNKLYELSTTHTYQEKIAEVLKHLEHCNLLEKENSERVSH